MAFAEILTVSVNQMFCAGEGDVENIFRVEFHAFVRRRCRFRMGEKERPDGRRLQNKIQKSDEICPGKIPDPESVCNFSHGNLRKGDNTISNITPQILLFKAFRRIIIQTKDAGK